MGHAYDQKYKPDTRAWIEAHIFNPGLAEALHALDGALAHQRYGDAVRAYRAACGANHAASSQDKTLADDLAKLDAVAAPAIATLDLGTASANQLRHALAQWEPCPATAPLEARLDQLAEQARARLPAATGTAAQTNLRRFIKEWSATPAASAAVAHLDEFAQAGLQAAQALPPGPKRVAALLAVARAWKDVPTGAKADQAAQDEASQLLHDAQAIKDLRARGQKEVTIARLMPATVIGELAMDDALLLSRQLAH